LAIEEHFYHFVFAQPTLSFFVYSVLPFWLDPATPPGTFPHRFAVARFTLFPDVRRSFSGKMSPIATQQDLMRKNSHRKFPKASVFTYGTPRQPPLQDYSADAAIRPSDPNNTILEDMRGSVSRSRSGVFFHPAICMKWSFGCL